MQFLQILSWILLPALLLAILLTVFFHYRKKKIADAEEDDEEKLVSASPEIVGYTNGDGEYVCFDHSPLISEYKNRLSSTHARLTALRHDYEKLESRYSALAGYAITQFRTKNVYLMENTPEQMPWQLQEEIDKIAAQFNAEKDELNARLERLNQSFKSLEEENQSLQDQLNAHSATGEEKESIFARWREENRILKEKVAEQQYLQDVLEEKRAQIGFLQSQLEQRIKIQHQVGQLRTQMETDLEEWKDRYRQNDENLRNELLQKQEHIDRLEGMLSENRELDGNLNALLSAANEKIDAMQHQLTIEQEKIQSLEQAAATNKQSLQRIYNEVSSILEGESTQSPVIALHPDYVERPDEEIAVH